MFGRLFRAREDLERIRKDAEDAGGRPASDAVRAVDDAVERLRRQFDEPDSSVTLAARNWNQLMDDVVRSYSDAGPDPQRFVVTGENGRKTVFLGEYRLELVRKPRTVEESLEVKHDPRHPRGADIRRYLDELDSAKPEPTESCFPTEAPHHGWPNDHENRLDALEARLIDLDEKVAEWVEQRTSLLQRMNDADILVESLRKRVNEVERKSVNDLAAGPVWPPEGPPAWASARPFHHATPGFERQRVCGRCHATFLGLGLYCDECVSQSCVPGPELTNERPAFPEGQDKDPDTPPFSDIGRRVLTAVANAASCKEGLLEVENPDVPAGWGVFVASGFDAEMVRDHIRRARAPEHLTPTKPEES